VPDPRPPDGPPHAAGRLPLNHFRNELEDAEVLIKYAADIGVDIDDEVRRHVIAARLASASGGWTEPISTNLLDALTKLSARLRPVSGESLRKCAIDREATATIRTYRKVATVLGLIIVPFSVAAFVSTATCDAIGKDIEMANGLAITLVRELALVPDLPGGGDATPSPSRTEDALKDLQHFAATNRALYARARKLKFFAVYSVPDPYPPGTSEAELRAAFELTVGTSTLSEQAKVKINRYQIVRHFARSVQEAVSTTFGAATNCILPMLYALLGACAYLIRSFEEQMKARTFTGSEKTTARFLIAGIGGLVVGLFGNFGVDAGGSLPPLAIAFLVGYAVDVFFYFLDGLLHAFTRARAEPIARAIPRAAATTKAG
jgi:hypothetical protein